MRCYDCNTESDTLYPIMQGIGRLSITVYVCKACYKMKLLEDEE